MQPPLNPIDPRILEGIQKGPIYFRGRDKSFRPVVVYNMNVIKTMCATEEDQNLIEAIVNFQHTYCLEHFLIPGQVEQWMIICDLDGVGLSEIPVRAMGRFLASAQNNFRARNYRSIVLNAGYLIRGSWYMLSNFVDELSLEKIQILSSDYKTVLTTMIDPQHLESRFGGSAPDKKDSFWPPEMPVEAKMLSRAEAE